MHGQMRRAAERPTKATASRRPRGILTRERILDSAEIVFATEGPGASLRTIMDRAAVNVASIHYHFGSREQLLDQIIARRAIIINRQRLALLDKAIKADPNDVSQILRALIQPAITLAMERDGWLYYFQLLGRLESGAEDIYGSIMSNYYSATHLAFLNALTKSLPTLSGESLVWR
ncbi:MAG: TetR family transcriptional regulator, partial [Pseudorhodoplanes sp.]